MKILHITDLHLDKSLGGGEALREGYFDEYLHDIIELAKQRGTIDKVFITGDIVNRYQIENYSLASKIVDYFSKKLNIPLNDIYITNGNHDLDRNSGCKQAYKDFISHIDAEKETIASGERYTIYKDSEDLVICLDSIGSNHSSGKPAPIESLEDEITTHIKTNEANNIYILSHHPALVPNQTLAYLKAEEIKFDETHIWNSGYILFNRLSSRAVVKGNVFWFCGDIHIPQHTINHENGNQIHCATGSLSFVAHASNNGITQTKQRPSARLIDTSNHKESFLYEFTPHNHTGKTCHGSWKEFNINATPLGIAQNNITKTISQDNTKSSCTPPRPNIANQSNFIVLDSSLENDIIEHVNSNDLYHFCRHIQKEELSALAWISIAGLFEKQTIYSQVIQKFREKIKPIADNAKLNSSKCLIIGIDNWGAIIAARLGAATNINSCGIGVSGDDKSYIPEEIVNDELRSIIKDKTSVFIVTDVIATGSTLERVMDKLDIDDTKNKYIFSIVHDNDQNRLIDFSMFREKYTACSKIKLPIIETHLLPPQ